MRVKSGSRRRYDLTLLGLNGNGGKAVGDAIFSVDDRDLSYTKSAGGDIQRWKRGYDISNSCEEGGQMSLLSGYAT